MDRIKDRNLFRKQGVLNLMLAYYAGIVAFLSLGCGIMVIIKLILDIITKKIFDKELIKLLCYCVLIGAVSQPVAQAGYEKQKQDYCMNDPYRDDDLEYCLRTYSPRFYDD